MAVPLSTVPRLEAGPPVVLFRVESEIVNYDASPDGLRFLVSTPAERMPQSPIRVILNWNAGLPGPK